MADLATILFLIVTAFANRLIAVQKSTPGFDLYGHLYFVKEVKGQKAGPFGSIKTKVVGSENFRNPFVWHWIVGFFPIKIVLKYQRLINSSLDALFSIALYFVSLRIGFSNTDALLLSLLYLFTPMFFSKLSLGSRINEFTPRLSSELATTLFFIVTLLPLDIPLWLSLALGALISFYVLGASKFGIQALLFITPLTSLFAQNVTPMIALVCGVLLLLVASKGDCVATLHEQLRHLGWYFIKNIRGEVPVSNRNSLKLLFQRPTRRKGILSWLGVVVSRALQSNSYTGMFLKLPALWVIVVIYPSLPFGFEDPLIRALSAPVMAAAVIYLLVNLRWLLFLGEAERYLNHVGYFIVALFFVSALNANASWVVYGILAYGFIYWILESAVLSIFFTRSESADDLVIQYLAEIPEQKVVLAYPFHSGGGVWRIMLETKHKVVYSVTTGKIFTKLFNEKYASDYPYIDLKKLDSLADDYDVDVLIVNENDFRIRESGDLIPSGRWKKVAVYGDIFAIYERKDIHPNINQSHSSIEESHYLRHNFNASEVINVNKD